jgi:hypothetical protein
MMSTNNGLEEEVPGQTQLPQTSGTIEKEHVNSHFRNHFQYWQRHPQKAAESCVRNWQQMYPDKAGKLTVEKVVEHRKNIGKSGQLARSDAAKHTASVPSLRQPKSIRNP